MSNRACYDAKAISLHDSTNLAYAVDAIMVATTAGDVTIVGMNNEVITLKALALNTIIPIKVKRVNNTATTAVGVIGLTLRTGC